MSNVEANKKRNPCKITALFYIRRMVNRAYDRRWQDDVTLFPSCEATAVSPLSPLPSRLHSLSALSSPTQVAPLLAAPDLPAAFDCRRAADGSSFA